jgi:hypothetical protein
MRSSIHRGLRFALCLGLAASAGGPVLAEQGVVGCPEFKSAWAEALAGLGVSRAPLSYGAATRDGAENVSGLRELEAAVTCRGGLLGHLELRSGGEAAPFDRAAASVLMALDRSLAPQAASAAVAALRSETRGGAQAAVGSAGPYELTLSGPPARPAHELVLDMAEN